MIGIGKVVEWSITAVLKTAVLRGTGGSNPSLSAEKRAAKVARFFLCLKFDMLIGVLPLEGQVGNVSSLFVSWLFASLD